MCSRVTLDGNVIEECVNAGDGKFKEGAWVKISEDYENHPERQQLAKFVGKYGRLTRRYHGCVAVLRGRLPHARAAVFACTSAVDGRTAVDSEMPRHRCWCIKWLERDEAIAQVRSPVLASSRPPARVRADCDAVWRDQAALMRGSVAQALGKSERSSGPWELAKLGREFHETWLAYVSKTELAELTQKNREELSRS